MATRRRTSATKSAKAASAPVTKESIVTVKKSSPNRARRVNKVTPIAKSIVTETPVTPVVEEVKAETKKSLPDFTKLRGLDFVIVPLVYLEAFVVNILQNLDLKVPDRVAIK